jgi:UDP-GlcNAc:undecaprenyl-phosphate GlcNAc-1-phosphate transferase
LQSVALVAVAAVFAGSIAAARRAAVALGLVAKPNPIVRSHRVPVPYLGGAGLVAAYLAVVAGFWALAGVPPPRDVLARSAVALAFVAFGTIDDVRPMGPWVKLLAQAVLCATYLLAVGTPPGLGLGFQLLVLVTLVNAYNIIDVMDGLLCVLSGLAVMGLLAASSLTPAHVVPELLIMLLGLAVLFLFNRPPARIYAGDAGSLTLGFLVAAWGLAAARDRVGFSALPVAGLWAVPLFELALVIPARLRQGRSPLRGSPDHYALRLQDQRGWSKWRVLAVSALMGAGFAAAPWVATHFATPAVALYVVACAATAAVTWILLWRIPPRAAKRDPVPAASPTAAGI